MMRKRGTVIIALALAFMTAVTFGVPDSSFAAGTQNSPIADDVEYYTTTKDGKEVKTGIKRIVIEPNTYTNISRDPDINPAAEGSDVAPTVRLNDATMQKIVEKYVFPKWGALAEGIFRNQADQLVTIEGSGMMSSSVSKKESFDKHFSYDRRDVPDDYKEYDWSLSDLADTLGNPPLSNTGDSTQVGEISVLQGKVCDDEVVFSGIYPIKNLSEARTLMGKSLRACSDDDNLTVDDFLGNKKDKAKKEYRLPDLDDDKTGKGFASIVTCVNRAGSSYDYDYNSFGLAVYDIDVTPIAANNVSYISAAQDYIGQANPLEAAQKAGVKGVYYDSQKSTRRSNYITNNSPQTSTNTVSLAHNVSEQISATTQETFTFGMDEQIGIEGRMGRNTDPFGGSLKYTHTFKETWASMKSNGKSQTTQENRTITTQVALPGHTAASIDQNIEEITAEEEYQQPVVINYKVAVFAMSGDYYNGSFGMGLISSNRYDKQWMSVLFDGSDAEMKNGCKALSSLYNRAVTQFSVPGYDGVHGKYRTWCDKSAWNESTKIEWDRIADAIKNDKRASHIVTDDGTVPATGTDLISSMASSLQFAEAATTFHADSNAMLTSVGEVVPLYNLQSVDISKGNKVYEVRKGQGDQTIYLDGIELKGYDKDEVEFYGFNTVKGSWQIKEVNPQAAADRFALRSSEALGQYLDVSPYSESDASCTLEWVPDPDQKIVSNESQDGMSKELIEKIQRPQIVVRAVGGTTDVSKVNLTGEYTGPYDTKGINLNKVLNVNVTDSSNKALSVPIYWESDGSKGIKVSENGDLSFTVPGTYRVRAFCRNDGAVKTSDWRQITATAKAELHSMKLDAKALDEETLTLNEKNKERTYDLNSLVSFRDQAGNVWEGTDEQPLPEVAFTIDEQDRSVARVDSEGFLTVDKGGTYEVTAKATDKESGKTMSDSAVIRITEDPWLEEIEFNRPDVGRNDLILNSLGDQIRISDLKSLLNYYDQNGYEWTGSKPKVSFKIAEDTSGAEIVAGGNYSFYAYQPGRYTIQPEISGYEVDPVHIDVTANENLVIDVAHPSRQILVGGEPVKLELERFLNGTTAFGETWKGDLPEMYFQLDEGVKGARIETETVTDSRTGESVEIHNFVSDTAGEYAIHVRPKQASAYPGSIDDIIINVVAYDSVSRLGFSKISEKTTGTSFTVNTYKEQYPQISVEQFVQYYDQNGELIDLNSRPNVVLPDIAFELVQYDENANKKEVSESDAVLKDGVLTIYTGGVYNVRVGAPKNLNIIQDEATIYAPDITWMHDFGEWKVTEPTCTEDGSRVRTCENDNCPICKKEGAGYHETITDIIPARNHHWTNIHEEYTENGARYAAIKCKECGAIRPSTKIQLMTNQIIVAPDSSSAKRSVVATCDKDGQLVLSRLTSGGTEHQYVNIPATGHYWGENYVTDEEHTADCNKKGSEWLVCEDCQSVKPGSEKPVPQLMHDYPVDEHGAIQFEVKTSPTCDKDGYGEAVCKHCGEAIGHSLPATGHTWSEDYVIGEDSTCAKEGSKWIECTVCHAKKDGIIIPIPKKEHTYPQNDDGSYIYEDEKDPTCVTDGYKVLKCTQCGEELRTDVPATGHSIEKVEARAATCEEPGNTEYYSCAECKKYFSDEAGEHEIEKDSWVIPATDHKYGDWKRLDDSQHQRVCEHDATHIEKADHEWDDGVIVTPATCEEKGTKTLTCKVCGAKKMEEIPATGHDWGEYTPVEGDAPACVEAGQEVRICKNDSKHKEYRHAEKQNHQLIKTDAKAATCTKPGNTEYYTCSVCEGVFSDAAGTIEISMESTVLPAKGHAMSSIEQVDATCEKAGTKAHHKCGNCGGLFLDAEGKVQVTEEGIVIPATGHAWGTPAYQWSENNSSVTATRICKNDAAHVETEMIDTSYEESREPTCVKAGVRTYTTNTFENPAFKVQKKTVETDPLGHDWGKATYTWSEDKSEVTATRVCNHDSGHKETETVETTSEITTAPTCEEAGVRTFTTKAFENDGFKEQTKNVKEPATGHSWGNVTYQWAKDYSSVTATRVCKLDSKHKETETVETTSQITTKPTCTRAGEKTFTTEEFANPAFKVRTRTVEVDATGHDWGNITYTWSEDMSSVTATRVCGNDSGHKETETVDTTSQVTTPPTCEKDGVRTFTTEAFKNPDFKEQKKKVKEPATGHKWGKATYTWSEDNSQVTAKLLCQNDTDHAQTETVYTTSEITTAPTCAKTGVRTFTSEPFESDVFKIQTKTVDEPTTAHSMVHHPAKAATNTAAGNAEYWHCSTCGQYFKDEAGTQKYAENEWVIPAADAAAKAAATDANTAIAKAGKISAGTYSAASYKAVTAAVSALNKVLANPKATAAEIKAATQNLQKAISALKMKQKLTVKKKTVKVKVKKVKKKSRTVKPLTVTGQKTTVTYKGTGINKKSKKALKINKKTGKITVKKKTKKGTYKMKVTVTAAGNAKYEKAKRTVTVIVKVTK